MFYSQFILAKKGPLGTIWIAAHLERKLRKNQVADTDIGDSVDSILSPEVPIALRLSSHLLLGVVRIYSRKVNYLFHDCSEALLKVKQAFRSTAVDLPPEESIAPYHSITLPETFHLDDFELPDTAIHGDFVDHHVSAKEYITLQDTMDGTGYSMLRFGLDETFGDGTASQIGLELEEDLFLVEDNDPSSQHDASTLVSDECAVHHDESLFSFPLTPMDIDDDDKSGIVKDRDVDPKDLSQVSNPQSMIYMKEYNIQTPDLNEIFSPGDPIEDASREPNQTFISSSANGVSSTDADFTHAAPTDGLREDIFSGNIYEVPATSFHPDPSHSSCTEVRPDCSLQAGHPKLVNYEMHGANMVLDSGNIVQAPPFSFSEPSNHREQVVSTNETQMVCEQKSVSGFQDGCTCGQKKLATVDEQMENHMEPIHYEAAQVEGLKSCNASHETIPSTSPLNRSQIDTEIFVTPKTSDENSHGSDLACAKNSNLCAAEVQPSGCLSAEHVEVSPSPNVDSSAFGSDMHLLCSTSQINEANAVSQRDETLTQNASGVSVEEPDIPSNLLKEENRLHKNDSSFELHGNDSHLPNSANAELELHQNPHDLLTEYAMDDHRNELLTDPCQKDTEKNQMNCSASSEFPEPEKMLLAPTVDGDPTNELSQVTEEKGVIESDGSVNRITSLSGKKRRIMETTSAWQIDSAGIVSGRSQSRKNIEYIPDDDDLLASILVGKRTPLMRIGPTPTLKETSQKRPKLTPRLNMLKRKVLLDDTTVLHADVIRQQLISTDDIKRMRKKAPCTRPEILMIERCSLEDEIFNEFIITGMPSVLNDLHKRRFLPAISQNNSYNEPPKESDHTEGLEFVQEAQQIETTEQILVTPECGAGETRAPSCLPLTTEGMIIPSKTDDISFPDTSNAAVIAEGNVDYPLSMHQLVDETVQPRDVSSAMNEEAQHISENASAVSLDYTHDDSKGGIVDNNALSIVNDPTTNAEAHESVDASIIDRSTRPLDTASLNEQEDINVVSTSTCPPDTASLNEQEDISMIAKGLNSEVPVTAVDNAFHESDPHLTTNLSTSISQGNTSSQDVNQYENGSVLNAIVEKEGLKSIHSEGNLAVGESSSGRLEMASLSPTRANIESEHLPSAVGENSSFQEFKLEGGLVVESTPMDIATAKDYSDFCSAIEDNDTEFLNVDDEADYHEEGDDVADPEDASLDNSGWSSRTRGVARYLKKVFDEESGHGRKSVAMDLLIARKSRKEASRMFFETLVLKTKDYIHVEQENSSGFITILPRPKLLKAEF
ncbi:sister chromatid cohesion 1 protein 4-like isoform X1 [Zingiber officinale]|uniref:sister chromatid cohesion 1 protein 4-like isoform X1 n=1 Tax=Zingiber officinale TaxID=94328 RepID=UPI001C4C00AA|nr:sister chromatid cohesion 1 protein 4-like isoform X1 [Zingiber officinale]